MIKFEILMQSDLISIITPMYKGAAFVGETIRSVLNQTYQSWEMIIVDDCSPDGGAGIAEVKKYADKDKRIRLIASPVNKGSSGARNIALKAAQGRFITFLDSDDILEPNYMESQLRYMKEKGAAIVTASYHRINETGEEVLRPFLVPDKVNYRDILKSNPISCLTTLYDRTLVGDHYSGRIWEVFATTMLSGWKFYGKRWTTFMAIRRFWHHIVLYPPVLPGINAD